MASRFFCFKKIEGEPSVGKNITFPTLGVTKSLVEIDAFLADLADRKKHPKLYAGLSSQLMLLFEQLSGADGTLIDWLSGKRIALRASKLHRRYDEIVFGPFGVSAPSPTSGRPSWKFELEVLFLYENGFSADVITTGLLFLADENQDYGDFRRSVKRVIARAKMREKVLYAASALTSVRRSEKHALEEFKKAAVTPDDAEEKS